MPHLQVYRISREKYAGSLNTSGASGRWNKKGQHVLYTSQSRALAALELLAHRNEIILAQMNYKIMIIQIPADEKYITEIKHNNLLNNWKEMTGYNSCQILGNNWYQNNTSLILKVPSALMEEENNYIINSQHPDFHNNIKLLKSVDYVWDDRVLYRSPAK